jgi:hypothetical protein
VFVRPSRRILLAALAPLLAATALGAQGSVPAGYQTQGSSRLADGVDHEALTLTDPAQSVNVARVAPGAARIVAVSSHDAVANQGAGGELPSDMCRRVGCFAGINADFRDAAGDAVGGVVSGGRLLRSPVPGRPQLIVTRDGRLQAGPLDWTGSVSSSDGRTVLAVGGVNVAPRPGDVVLFTPAWGGDTPAGADTELVVRSTGAIGTIGGVTPMEIIGIRSDGGPIPSDGAVLAASGSASATLHAFADRAAAGHISTTLSLRIRTSVDAVESVGGNPVVLRDGQPAFPAVDDSFTRDRHPRALVGWNPAGEVVLVTVDAGRDDAAGLTLAEAADLLIGLGATDGFGFDDRAATFVAAGEVKNRPVGDLEPPVVNALMVVAKLPDPPPTPPTTTNPGSGSKPGSTATTPTTAPVKVTGAGGGSAPATGVPAPAVTPGSSVLPGTVGDILRDPTTKRPRRQTGKGGKVKKDKDEPEEYAGDPSIPDWNDITAALTHEEIAAAEERGELAAGFGDGGQDGGASDVAPLLLGLVAAGMIGTVLWGLQRVRTDSRPRPLWY